MNITLVKTEDNRATIRVGYNASDVSRHFERVLRRAGKGLKIAGFRPGKIPPNVVRNRLGTEELQQLARDDLREDAVRQAVKELKLEVRSQQAEFSGDELPMENAPYEVEFRLLLMPKVVLPDYRSFKLPLKKVTVTERMKADYRERLRDRFTEYHVKPGAVEMGDAVVYDLTTSLTETGEPAPLAHQDVLYRTGERDNLPGYDEHFVGRTPPAQFSFDYKMPEDFVNEEVAGKTLTFSVTLKEVKQVVRPELTLDFIREHFKVADMREFDKMVEDSLSAQLEAEENAYREDVALEHVAGRAEAHISDDMAKQEIDYLVSSRERALRARGQSLAAVLKQRGQTLEELRDELREEAVHRIREFLVVKEIAEAEGYKVSKEEFARYAGSLARRYSLSKKQLAKLMKNREFLNDTTAEILRAKVKRHLAQAVTFYYEDEESPEETEEDATGSASASARTGVPAKEDAPVSELKRSDDASEHG